MKGSQCRCTPFGQPNLALSPDLITLIWPCTLRQAILISTAGEAPGLLACMVLIDSRGRRWTLQAGMLLCGGALLLLAAAAAVSGGGGGGAHGALALLLLFVARGSIEVGVVVLGACTASWVWRCWGHAPPRGLRLHPFLHAHGFRALAQPK